MCHPRHLRDVRRSVTSAQAQFMLTSITAYTYAFQGQYVLPVAFQGVSNYVWQSVGNGLSLWTYTSQHNLKLAATLN